MKPRTSAATTALLAAIFPLALATIAHTAPPANAPTSRPTTKPTTKPTSGPASRPTRAAPAKPTQELLDLWKEIEPRREEAVAHALKVEMGESMERAHLNMRELTAKTKKLNELLAPVAAGSSIRYPSPQPKPGAGPGGLNRAIWLYKAARAIETFNATKQAEMTDDEYGVFRELNKYREALGLVPLEYHLAIRDAARGHSDWMRETGIFDHESQRPGYKTFAQRIQREGYTWNAAAENIAEGHASARAVFIGWFESPGHHHNLVGDYAHMGVGKIGKYWTQNFAKGEPIRSK